MKHKRKFHLLQFVPLIVHFFIHDNREDFSISLKITIYLILNHIKIFEQKRNIDQSYTVPDTIHELYVI